MSKATHTLPIVSGSPRPARAAEPAGREPRGRYAFISLGCPKNHVDSERMLGLLQLDGYELVDEPDGADFVVVNTCGFIEQARTESFQAIDEMLELKRRGRTRGVIVSGCLAERQQEDLLAVRPEIDSLVGVFGREEVTRVADRLLGDLDEQRTVFRPAPVRALPDRDRLRITPRHFAYLKISEGCDRLCTFCAIPQMRGKHATKPIEEVMAEATELVEDGVRELIVVAQDTTYYGMDLYGRPRLAELLQQLDQIAGLEWIRLMYFYPMYVDDDVLDVIAQGERILPYVDMPLQHIDDRMLRRMSRRVDRRQTEELLARMRERIPGLTLRTTFITGFPGETDEAFAALVEFVERQRFQHVGVFTYSFEADTPSGRMADQLPEDVKARRRDTLMQVQQPIVFAHQRARVGSTETVLLDQRVPDQPHVWVGRTAADAPDVDGIVFVTSESDRLRAGQFVECEIVETQDYDLVAYAVGEPHEGVRTGESSSRPHP